MFLRLICSDVMARVMDIENVKYVIPATPSIMISIIFIIFISYVLFFPRLICSDAMARGMDVENVKYVISYDSPAFIKTYIHRVGRTARAGKVGTALTLLEKKEVQVLCTNFF